MHSVQKTFQLETFIKVWNTFNEWYKSPCNTCSIREETQSKINDNIMENLFLFYMLHVLKIDFANFGRNTTTHAVQGSSTNLVESFRIYKIYLWRELLMSYRSFEQIFLQSVIESASWKHLKNLPCRFLWVGLVDYLKSFYWHGYTFFSELIIHSILLPSPWNLSLDYKA